MSLSPRAPLLGPLVLAAGVLLAPASSPILAAGPDLPNSESRDVPVAPGFDRENGEEEQIRARREWFFGSRMAGADGHPGKLRAKALEQTRRALDAPDFLQPFGAGSWEPKGPASSNFGNWTFGKIAGRVIALAWDARISALYAGAASGGLWRTTDGGTTWTSLLDRVGSQSVGAIALDPTDPNVIWAGTGEDSNWCEEYFGIGLLRTTDGGATWETRNGAPGADIGNLSAFASVLVDPRNRNRLVVGGSYADCVNGNYVWGGLYTSTDAGATWTARLPGAGIHDIERSRQNPDVLWATAENAGLYKSTDGGDHWSLQTASGLLSGNIGRSEVAISPLNDNYVFALFSGGGNQFWRTVDGGASWTKQATGSTACDGQCWYNMTLAASPLSLHTVYRGTVKLYRSFNGGTAWTDMIGGWGSAQKVHQDIQELLIDPSLPNTIWVGSDGGVWRSTDAGATFQSLNANLNLTQFYGIAIHPTSDDILLGGAQDNSSLARPGPSNQWDLQMVTGDGFLCAIHPGDPQKVYISSYPWGTPSIFRSTNGLFGSYQQITGTSNGISGSDRANWVTPYVLDPTQPDTMLLGTQRVYRSTNAGTTWVGVGPADMTLGSSATLVSLEFNRVDGNAAWAGTTDGRVWRSANRGATWTDVSAGLPARSINDLAGDPSDPAKGFAVVGGFSTPHLWEWNGSGAWVARGADLPNAPCNSVIALSATDLFVGCDTGVFVSFDRGTSFAPFVAGLPLGVPVTDLKFNPVTGTLSAGTYGRGAWQYPLTQPGTAPREASGSAAMTASKGSEGRVAIAFTPACGATSHVVYRAEGTSGAAPAWNGATCGVVPGGTVDVGEGGAEGLALFVVVGQNGLREGSYGTDSSGAELPEAVEVGDCDRPRDLLGSCP